MPAYSTVRRIRFLPHVPVILGESSRARAVRTARLIKASDCKEEFGKSGEARMTFRECTDARKFIPGVHVLAFFASNHVRLGAASMTSSALGILNQVSDDLHENACMVSQYMDLNNLPSVSRNAVNVRGHA